MRVGLENVIEKYDWQVWYKSDWRYGEWSMQNLPLRACEHFVLVEAFMITKKYDGRSWMDHDARELEDEAKFIAE
jgi:hypothetical protein